MQIFKIETKLNLYITSSYLYEIFD